MLFILKSTLSNNTATPTFFSLQSLSLEFSQNNFINVLLKCNSHIINFISVLSICIDFDCLYFQIRRKKEKDQVGVDIDVMTREK